MFNANFRTNEKSDASARRLASASKDGTVKVWDVLLGRCLFTVSGHAMSVCKLTKTFICLLTQKQ